MPKMMRDLEAEVLDLSREERTHLADVLLSSLEEEEAVENEWVEVARRRYEDIRSGRVETIDNEEVFARLRARFG
jgi:putative addiction module component (TIGR02574 family)